METVKNMYGTQTYIHKNTYKDSKILWKFKLENLKMSSNISQQIKNNKRSHNLVYSKLERHTDYILKVASDRFTKCVINAN